MSLLPPANSSRVGSGSYVLVVEDVPIWRATIQGILEQAGYATLGAADGAAGLALFREYGAENIRAVVTDLEMPVMTGMQLLAAVQQLDPAMKVLCLSASMEALAKVPQAPRRVSTLSKMAIQMSLLGRLEELLQESPSPIHRI